MLLELAQWLAKDVRLFNVFSYLTLRAVSKRDATLLVKGSRFMRMERVVAALTGNAGGGH